MVMLRLIELLCAHPAVTVGIFQPWRSGNRRPERGVLPAEYPGWMLARQSAERIPKPK
jgi:hypothetical protein